MQRLAATLLFAAALALPAAGDARSLDEGFDREPNPIWSDTIRQAKLAYQKNDYDKAFAGFQRAACAGDKGSQMTLGSMYLLGQGTKRNDYEGYAWVKTAAEYRFRGYQSTLDKLREAMSPDQLKDADARAAAVTEAYGLRATNVSCSDSASRGGLIQDIVVCTPRYEGRNALMKRCVATPAP